jgi:hypothetical protein
MMCVPVLANDATLVPSGAKCAKPRRADIHNTTHPTDGKYGLVLFPSRA